MKLEPYLCIDGQEVANAMRTLTYLRRGLAGPWFEVGMRSPMLQEGAGYSDVYTDVYERDPFAAENLSCYCEALDEGVYVDPETDEAPWWESARPESADFLGMMVDVELDSVLARSVSPRLGFGSSLGVMRARHRIVSVTGQMFAASAKGMAWGERWLIDVLSGALCEDDDTVSALVLPTCPGADDDADTFFRTLLEVGVVDGPVFGAMQGVPECAMQSVSFQLAAGVPHLLAPGVRCVDTVQLPTAADGAAGCIVESEEWVGDTAVKVTVTAAEAVADIVITATPLAEDQDDCPIPGTASPAITYSIPELEAGDQVTIDAATRTVTRFNPTAKRYESGYALLDIDGPLHWIEVPACSRVCVAVSGDGDGSVTIESIGREL